MEENKKITRSEVGDAMDRICDFCNKVVSDDDVVFSQYDLPGDIRIVQEYLSEALPQTAEWVEDKEQIHVEKTYHCSSCGFRAWGDYEKTEYCGGCGSKMKDETNRPYDHIWDMYVDEFDDDEK